MDLMAFILQAILLPIGLIILFVVVLILVIKKMKKGKKMTKEIRGGKIPEQIKKVIRKKFQDYEPKANISEAIANVAVLSSFSFRYGTNTNMKRVYNLYRARPWKKMLDFKDTLMKCYTNNRWSSMNVLNLHNLLSITITKVKEGTILSVFSDKKMRIYFNQQLVGVLDYETKKVFNSRNKEIGSFKRPGLWEIMGIGGLSKGLDIELTLNNRKIASIRPIPGTIKSIKKLVKSMGSGSPDLHLFRDVDVRNSEEALILLGYGLGEYGLVTTKM